MVIGYLRPECLWRSASPRSDQPADFSVFPRIRSPIRAAAERRDTDTLSLPPLITFPVPPPDTPSVSCPAQTMSAATSRLSALLSHFTSTGSKGSAPSTSSSSPEGRYQHNVNFHTLSPTFFLPRAAAIEPEVSLL